MNCTIKNIPHGGEEIGKNKKSLNFLNISGNVPQSTLIILLKKNDSRLRGTHYEPSQRQEYMRQMGAQTSWTEWYGLPYKSYKHLPCSSTKTLSRKNAVTFLIIIRSSWDFESGELMPPPTLGAWKLQKRALHRRERPRELRGRPEKSVPKCMC